MNTERLAAIEEWFVRLSPFIGQGAEAYAYFKELKASIDALQAENERLRNSLTVTDIETLSAELHAIYQAEARRQAGRGDDTVRHPDDYAALAEHTKEYDRVLARFILQREAALQARVTLLEGLLVKAGACATVLDDDPAAMQLMRQIDAALSRTP